MKSLVSFPPVLQMMGSQLSWTQNLGNAVLAQQSDVMNAIQSLRAKAQQSGALKSNAQQSVSGGNGDPIIIQPANPQVVYVPTYNPAVAFGGLLCDCVKLRAARRIRFVKLSHKPYRGWILRLIDIE